MFFIAAETYELPKISIREESPVTRIEKINSPVDTLAIRYNPAKNLTITTLNTETNNILRSSYAGTADLIHLNASVAGNAEIFKNQKQSHNQHHYGIDLDDFEMCFIAETLPDDAEHNFSQVPSNINVSERFDELEQIDSDKQMENFAHLFDLKSKIVSSNESPNDCTPFDGDLARKCRMPRKYSHDSDSFSSSHIDHFSRELSSYSEYRNIVSTDQAQCYDDFNQTKIVPIDSEWQIDHVNTFSSYGDDRKQMCDPSNSRIQEWPIHFDDQIIKDDESYVYGNSDLTYSNSVCDGISYSVTKYQPDESLFNINLDAVDDDSIGTLSLLDTVSLPDSPLQSMQNFDESYDEHIRNSIHENDAGDANNNNNNNPNNNNSNSANDNNSSDASKANNNNTTTNNINSNSSNNNNNNNSDNKQSHESSYAAITLRSTERHFNEIKHSRKVPSPFDAKSVWKSSGNKIDDVKNPKQNNLSVTTIDSQKAITTPSKATRCAECNKKLGIIMIMKCHCNRVFCSKHRYAEAHNCPYDFKSEGRKEIVENNPLVVAPKLPKI